MTQFDFTSIMERKGHDATAYDAVGQERVWGYEPTAPKEGFDFIPLWVADMNFPTCPAVTRAIVERAQHPAFGYFAPSDAYYQAICDWRRPGHPDIAREVIGYENGVHGFLSSAVHTLTKPGDAILLHSPVYVGFRSDVERLGRKGVYSPLMRDADGIWRMDFDDMARRIREEDVQVAIFCSPHNPSGRVWERWELERAMEVFEAARVTVLSDEIWADLVFAGHEHIPTQQVSDWAKAHTLAAYAPSKTFNLAGLVGSYHVIYDDELREQVTAHGDRTNYNEMNVLSMHALIGGYSEEGHAWVRELNDVIEGNARFAVDFIEQRLPGVSAAMPQGTYMLFLDCTGYCEQAGRTLDELVQAGWDVGVGWQDGRNFRGPCHIRLNLASPLSRIEEAFSRMERYCFV